MPETLLTASEVAQLLKLNIETVYKLIRTAGLPAAKVGSQWRFIESEVQRWVHSQSEAPRRARVPQSGSKGVSTHREESTHG